MRTIDMSNSYNVEGECVVCGEEIIQATVNSSNECTRCGESAPLVRKECADCGKEITKVTVSRWVSDEDRYDYFCDVLCSETWAKAEEAFHLSSGAYGDTAPGDEVTA